MWQLASSHALHELCLASVNQEVSCCSLLGHFAAAGVPNKRKLAEFPVSADALLPPGTPITAAHFTAGQYVDIQGELPVSQRQQGVRKMCTSYHSSQCFRGIVNTRGSCHGTVKFACTA